MAGEAGRIEGGVVAVLGAAGAGDMADRLVCVAVCTVLLRASAVPYYIIVPVVSYSVF